ncbi:hypothetical protein ACJX0J_009493, partial [Zea mays]
TCTLTVRSSAAGKMNARFPAGLNPSWDATIVTGFPCNRLQKTFSGFFFVQILRFSIVFFSEGEDTEGRDSSHNICNTNIKKKEKHIINLPSAYSTRYSVSFPTVLGA